MGLKCCVPNCDSNYDKNVKKSGKYVSVYSFPRVEEERNKWKKVIPRSNLVITDHTRVCRLHWPENADFVKVRGGMLRPKNPPSLFPNIPKSCLPQPSPKERTTTKSLTSVRNVQEDELEKFMNEDKLNNYSQLSDLCKASYKELLF